MLCAVSVGSIANSWNNSKAVLLSGLTTAAHAIINTFNLARFPKQKGLGKMQIELLRHNTDTVYSTSGDVSWLDSEN